MVWTETVMLFHVPEEKDQDHHPAWRLQTQKVRSIFHLLSSSISNVKTDASISLLLEDSKRFPQARRDIFISIIPATTSSFGHYVCVYCLTFTDRIFNYLKKLGFNWIMETKNDPSSSLVWGQKWHRTCCEVLQKHYTCTLKTVCQIFSTQCVSQSHRGQTRQQWCPEERELSHRNRCSDSRSKQIFVDWRTFSFETISEVI